MVIITAIATKSRHTWSKFHLLNSNKLIFFIYCRQKYFFLFCKIFRKRSSWSNEKVHQIFVVNIGLSMDHRKISTISWSFEVKHGHLRSHRNMIRLWIDYNEENLKILWPDPCTASFLTYNALNLGQFLCMKCPHDHSLLRTESRWLQSLIYFYTLTVSGWPPDNEVISESKSFPKMIFFIDFAQNLHLWCTRVQLRFYSHFKIIFMKLN